VFQKRSSLIGSDNTVPNVNDLNVLALAPAFEASVRSNDNGSRTQRPMHTIASLSKMLRIEFELRGDCRTSRFGWNPAGTPALELAGFEIRRSCEKAVSVGGRGGLQAPLRSEDRAVTYM